MGVMSTFARVKLDESTRPWVFSTFGTSYQKYSGLNRKDYNRVVIGPFERALEDGDLTILALAAAPDDFVAWSLTLGANLVYLYVKEVFRNRGIGRSLLAPGLTGVVYQTPAGIWLQQHKYGKALRLQPFALLAERQRAA